MMAIQYNSNYDGTIPFSDVSYPVHLGSNVEETIKELESLGFKKKEIIKISAKNREGV